VAGVFASTSPLRRRAIRSPKSKTSSMLWSPSISHEQWVKDDGAKRYKVTVDCPKEPFIHDLIRYMARQAGVSKWAFYAALDQ
jgi:hypothetical protein